MISLIRRTTAILIIFQMVVIFIIVSFHVMNKQITYRYQLDEIEESLKGKEFIVHDLNKEIGVKRLKNNICLDSQGVYRQCDDDTYERMIELAKKDKSMFKDSGQEEVLVGRKDRRSKITNTARKMAYHMKKASRIKKASRMKKASHMKIAQEYIDYNNLINEKALSALLGNEIWQDEGEWGKGELASQQSSAMGNITKIVSSKVKNSGKRFVSDERILFSKVYEQVDEVEDVRLLVIVNSGARKRARRDSIRATWWTQCSQDSHVRCFFFTDDFNSPSLKSAKRELLREKQKYNDVVFQPIDTGLKFGYRILFQMQWSVAHYRFQYLLRVDDDALVCLHHLLHDLKNFPTSNFQWGHLHCDSYDVIYIDEGLTMFSHDLVLKFLSQNPIKMRCHVFGDQQVAIWINDLNLDPEEIYVHDSRIHHNPPASKMKEYFYELDDICKKHIIIHGVYPGDMEDFWEASNRKQVYSNYEPMVFGDACEKPAVFHWYAFGHAFRYKPKYCKNKPEWKEDSLLENGAFAGREGRYENF